ncbi:hypothetical protein I6A84_25065 [Frankia sp. CNm7]|uniref:Bacterial transcriptional activator domain-containing protein n=1 Tax=Frankia nepalensis TaxID=1836974 RepID=A0A937RJP1_9ACTN|nr:BTAD domain-containing putative transcriptional regulator [Frankia nepalensis]MBL7501201.1 hypothetical protein [Frankia nepalensis]MBL7514194.1 hypothetical protein [Frankia nepalensis]MBL7521270.1 hypothetical protein [Frankia nepalensis]MBL7631417.1 hypothetical protein [Frankia nepalensis]
MGRAATPFSESDIRPRGTGGSVPAPPGQGRLERGAPIRPAGQRRAQPVVDIRLLGEFEVLLSGDPAASEPVVVPVAAWGRRQAMSLVKLLALAPGRRLHRERVLDALWPEVPVDEAAPRLHKAAHYARRALGGGDGVVLRGETVALCPDRRVAVDAEVFEAAARRALAGDAMPWDIAGPWDTSGPRDASGPRDEARRVDLAAAAHAASLYRGPLLPDDLYEPWTWPGRDRLFLLYTRLLRAAGHWERLLLEDPADEQAHLALMRRHAARGDRQGALRQFERLERALRDELGVPPGPTAVALRAAVLTDLPVASPIWRPAAGPVRSRRAEALP